MPPKSTESPSRDIATFFGGTAKPPPIPKLIKPPSVKANPKGAHPDLVITPKAKAGKQSVAEKIPVTSTSTTSKHLTAKAMPSKDNEIVISSSDDEKPFASTSKKSISKKAVIANSDEEMADGTAKKKAALKRKSNAVAESEEDKPSKKAIKKVVSAVRKKAPDEDSTDDEEPVKVKKSAEKKPPVKRVKKEVEEEDLEDGIKPKSKVKKEPVAKKVKQAVKEEVLEEGAEPKKKWSYTPKAGPSAEGSKEVPVGEPNCLAGLTFVFTGELVSLSRESGIELAKQYGGRVTSAPSGKTSYVVVGSEAGPKKLETIAKLKLKTLTEDEFLDLIGKRESGAADPKFVAQKEKETAKIKADAKTIGLAVDAPEHSSQLWTVKYAPKALKDICGNKGSVENLSKWLETWPASLKSDFKKPGPNAMGTYRAVLISGPPGIGKTTAAHLIAKLAGYSILELNASDVRSKKLLENAFSDTISNKTLSGFFKNDGFEAGLANNTKSIIIMDEVDGMSAGDRGGAGALNALIKKTRVPIIAICNDKSNPKMKLFQSTCFPMTFKRPSANEIRSRMMSIAFKEKIKIESQVVDQFVAGSQSDIRQIINMLSTYKLSAASINFDQGKQMVKASKKNSIETPWTLHSKLCGPQAFSTVSGMTLNDKNDLYFHDHSIMPLFVQENYLKMKYSKSNGLVGPEKSLKDLELMSLAASSISDGDLVDKMIHGGQHWSLMPVHGMFSCVRPASYTYGSGGFPNFPAWLGKTSTSGKLGRNLTEIQIRMRLQISGDKKEIRNSYLPLLFEKIVRPLIELGVDAIPDIIATMDDYYLTKDDWDTIVEMGIGPGYSEEALLKQIPGPTKAAFTRAYNKVDHPLPFASKSTEKPKKLSSGSGEPAPDFEGVQNEDVIISEDEEEGIEEIGFAKDKMIKEKIKKKVAVKGITKAKVATKKR